MVTTSSSPSLSSSLPSVDLEKNAAGVITARDDDFPSTSPISMRGIWKEAVGLLELPEEVDLDASFSSSGGGSTSVLPEGEEQCRNGPVVMTDSPEQITYELPNDETSQPSLIFEPLKEAPEGYPKLNFRPFLLRTWFLTGVCILCLIAMGCILLVDREAESTNRIFCTSDINQRLAWEYGPMFVSTSTKLLWNSVFGALSRTIPFFSLARTAPGRKGLGGSAFWLLSFLHRRWYFWITGLLRWILLVILPLLKSAFIIAQPYNRGDVCQGFYVSHPVALALAALYFILAAIAASLLIRLYGRSTGLKWDPVSIADKLALFHGSNVLPDFDIMEGLPKIGRMEALRKRVYRIGYWSVSLQPADSYNDGLFRCHGEQNPYIWYGIAREGKFPLSSSTDIHTRNSPYRKATLANPYRSFHPRLMPVGFLMWLLLLLAFLVFLFIASRHPMTLSIPSATATLVFRAILTNVITILSSVWTVADFTYRATQPFAGMCNPAPAGENIFLHYSSDLPGVVTWNALKNRHYKVAYFSMLSLFMQSVAPAIGGTLFTITAVDKTTSIVGPSAPWKVAIMAAILIICLFSVFFAWPSPKRRLPHRISDISDLLILCHASNLLRDPALCVQRRNDTKEHLYSKLFLAEYLYQFGRYTGTDRATHVGFDIQTRNRMGQPHVRWIEPQKGFSIGGWLGQGWTLRKRNTGRRYHELVGS
ncbi:hypothetical protein GYMLUDRAFT_87704 [Collybiopsis luxurians FD-317 M1]|uniref:Uncharacterized protein n=1 Tax=Collybiopsis luxurians FD-317 M1 TaxID=944289 RepID=A0A0D0BKF2_9AGAR|nr:hypothetical protein GYMLUDRAFT_87704 [Collybiopsis luxurians FD-317 M1]